MSAVLSHVRPGDRALGLVENGCTGEGLEWGNGVSDQVTLYADDVLIFVGPGDVRPQSAPDISCS